LTAGYKHYVPTVLSLRCSFARKELAAFPGLEHTSIGRR
jgi:hypothetical protein